MRHAPDAKPGAVLHPEYIDFEDIGRGTAVLCRNNAPLLGLTLDLIKAGYSPKLVGRDVLEETIKTLEKITKRNMSVADALDSVSLWADEKKQTWKSANVVEDKADCMRVFLKDAKDAGDAISRARALQAQRYGDIVLSTIHKAKGAEYENTIIVDRYLIGKDGQEENLLYVGQTRAKNTLSYCMSDCMRA